MMSGGVDFQVGLGPPGPWPPPRRPGPHDVLKEYVKTAAHHYLLGQGVSNGVAGAAASGDAHQWADGTVLTNVLLSSPHIPAMLVKAMYSDYESILPIVMSGMDVDKGVMDYWGLRPGKDFSREEMFRRKMVSGPTAAHKGATAGMALLLASMLKNGAGGRVPWGGKRAAFPWNRRRNWYGGGGDYYGGHGGYYGRDGGRPPVTLNISMGGRGRGRGSRFYNRGDDAMVGGDLQE